MLIEEAIEIMNNFIKDTPKAPFECLMNKEVEAVETLLNELEKKDKVIDILAEDLRYNCGMGQDDLFCIDICFQKRCDKEKCKERIKEYAYNRAENFKEKVSDNK